MKNNVQNSKRAMSQPKKAKVLPKTNRTIDPDLESYALALADPFNEHAIGARVPDMYSYPTATYHAEGTIVIPSTSGGNASFLLGANPFTSMVDITSTVGVSGMAPYTANNPHVFAAASQTNLSGVLTNWRVVGCGFQIRNLIPPTTATGRIICAKTPALGPIAGPNLLSNSALNMGNGIIPLYTGINTGASTTGFATDILELPDAQEFTIQDVISTAVQVNLKPLSPAAFDFYDTSNDQSVSSSWNLIAGDYLTSGTDAVSGFVDSVNGEIVRGWDCLLINANGLPASTNCFEIKYIYHFEGTPVLQSSAGAITPGIEPKVHVNPTGHALVLSKICAMPSMRVIGSAVSAMTDAYFGNGTANLARTVLSKLGITL